MGPATRSGAVDPWAAPAVRDGVVSRPGLFELLGAAGRSQVVLAIVRMRFARQRGDLAAVTEQAQRLLAPAGAATQRSSGWAGTSGCWR